MSYERLSSSALPSPVARQKSSALFLVPALSIESDTRYSIIINPKSAWYKGWFMCVCIGACATAIMEPLCIAFGLQSSFPILEYLLLAFYTIDILISSRLAYNDESHHGALVSDIGQIQAHYFSFFSSLGTFWWDLLALIPWTSFVLLVLGEMDGGNNTGSQLVLAVTLCRLVRMVRCYRLYIAFEHQIEHHAQQLVWILLRNLAYLAFILHLSACSFWFIARIEGFSDESWVSQWSPSSNLEDDPLKAYVMSLYFVTATYATVGFGDIRPSTSAEVVFVTVFIFINVLVSAYVIGTITLVVVRSDQQKTTHRQTLNVLSKFCKTHKLPTLLRQAVGEHINHRTKHEESSDELLILSTLPSSLKLRVLRFLHLPQLQRCYLFKGCSSKTLDAILAASRVETYLPATEIISAHDSVPDLFIVLKGSVECAESQYGPGDCFAEASFFTNSASEESLVAHSHGVSRLLLISHLAFESSIVEKDVQTIYQNLLQRCEDRVRRSGGSILLPHAQQIGGASTFSYARDQQSVVEAMRVRALVSHHLQELNLARIYKFLSAASRGDESTLSTMVQQGMDVNAVDYDARSALMLAASKGNVHCLQLLLQSGANPSLIDAGGCNALMEACKQGSSQACDILMNYGARLSNIDPSILAGYLCRAVSECDGRLLTRLIQAGADCGAADYDSRTALHIAASDGNLAMAAKLLEGGAPLAVEDRFGFTPLDEARRAGAGPLVDFLQQRVTESEAKVSLDKFILGQTTRLLNACSSGDLASVKHLLEVKGCPVDASDYDGRTGLHLGAAKGHGEVVSLLVNFGADAKREDNFGHTAVDEARKNGHSEIEASLLESPVHNY